MTLDMNDCKTKVFFIKEALRTGEIVEINSSPYRKANGDWNGEYVSIPLVGNRHRDHVLAHGEGPWKEFTMTKEEALALVEQRRLAQIAWLEKELVHLRALAVTVVELETLSNVAPDVEA